jgi:hypothetical protein
MKRGAEHETLFVGTITNPQDCEQLELAASDYDNLAEELERLPAFQSLRD